MLASEQVIRFPLHVPFTEGARPNTAAFFRDAHWGMCLELLGHLCQYGKQMLVVVGPTGIGKTAMKYAIENRHLPNIHIIDDAHNLSLDQVARLLHEQEQRVVLFARPELLTRVHRTALRDAFKKQARIIEIEPLTIDEMHSFLLHQWQLMGNKDAMPCTKAQMQKIYTMTDGIPGRVKQLFLDSLRGHDMLEEKSDARTFSPFVVGLAVACGIAFCLLALMWPTAKKPSFEQNSLPEPSSLVAQVPVTSELDGFVGGDLQASLQSDNLESDDPQMNAEQQEKLLQLEEKLAILQQQLDIEDQTTTEAPRSAQPAAPTPAPTAVPAPAPRPLQKSASKAALQTSAKTQSKSTLQLGINKQEQALLAINKQHYALQLVAASNEQKIKDFIKNNHLEGRAHYYKTMRDGKPWYTVIYGDFSDKTAALADLGNLPAGIKKLGPWARKYTGIHAAINQNLTHD